MPKTTRITERHCLRCGRSWLPRKPGRPGRCPNERCHSTNWDVPYPEGDPRRALAEAASAAKKEGTR